MSMSRSRGVNLQQRKTSLSTHRADLNQHYGEEKRYVVDSIEIESHDLELLYNTVVRDDKIRREKDRKCYGYSGATLSKNIITILIGLITAMVAFGISVFVSFLLTQRNELIHKGLESKYGEWGGLGVITAWTVVLSMVPAAMVKFYAPAAGGGGVTVIMALLNGNHIPDVLRPRTLITKIIGNMLSVSSGLAVGPEGPLIFSGAAIASMLSRLTLWKIDGETSATSQNAASRRSVPPREVVDIVSDTTRRELMSAGAAAGLAAAFGTPIGGVLFAIEEAISAWSRKVVWRCFLAAGTASFILSQLLGLRGRSGLISFSGLSGKQDWLRQLPLIMLTAAAASALGAFFSVSQSYLAKLRACHSRRWLRVIEVGLVALVSVALVYGLTVVFGRCSPIPPTWAGKGETVRLGCVKGFYNDLGTLFLAKPDETVRKLLSLGSSDQDTMDEARMHPINLGLFVVSYFIMMSLACGTAIPGGLFLPAVMLGSSFGTLTAMWYKMILPSVYQEYNPIQPGLFALIGATAMLAGVFRSTISVVVIMVEGTDGLAFLFPIIVSVIVGNWASHHIIDSGVYEADLEREARVAFLSPEPRSELVHLSAGDIMCHSPILLTQQASFGTIVKALSTNKHNGFPVVEYSRGGTALLRGVVLRSQLLVLLGYRAAEINREVRLNSNGSVSTSSSTPSSSPARSRPDTTENLGLLGRSHHKSLDIAMRLYHQLTHPYRRHLSSHQAELHALGISSLIGLGTADGSAMGDVTGVDWLDDDILDLGPYMNLGPLSVSIECPATRVHTLFRAMQLRHLSVVDKNASVVGIITRKDLHHAVDIAAPFSSRKWSVARTTTTPSAASLRRDTIYEELDPNIEEEEEEEEEAVWGEKDTVHIAPFDDYDLPSLP